MDRWSSGLRHRPYKAGIASSNLARSTPLWAGRSTGRSPSRQLKPKWWRLGVQIPSSPF